MEVKKIISLLLVAVLALSMVAGCGEQASTDGEAVSITYWIKNYASAYIDNYDEMAGMQAIQDETGVDVEFIHPVGGQEAEQFNVMIASGDYPDVVENDWAGYQGGILAAVNDNVILSVDQFMTKDQMPNYMKFLDGRPDVVKAIKCSDGTTNIFPHLGDSNKANPYIGPTIRKDWLDKLGLEMPETIDDWYTVLKAFKEQDPNGNGQADEIPFTDDGTFTAKMFAAAFGASNALNLDENGKMVYGATTDGYKEYLEVMNKWYTEGLIDREYAAQARKNVDYKMTNDIAGSYVGFSGSQMGKYIPARQGTDFKLVATHWPKKDANSPAYAGYAGLIAETSASKGAAITSMNKNVDATIRLFDFMYGEKASLYLNYGIEGESYNVVDGEYQFSDSIMRDPEGKDPTGLLAKYATPLWGCMPGVTLRDAYDKMSRSYEEQSDAAVKWGECDTSRLLPSLSFTTEEMEVINVNLANVSTCMNEWTSKFIMGLEPLSKWDAYVAEINKMGADKVVAVYQAAYDRYLSY